MSRKSKTDARQPTPAQPVVSAPPAAAGKSRRGLLIGAGAAVLVAGAVGSILYAGERSRAERRRAESKRPGLDSSHAPTLGDASAKVQIVEFLDPACETCAMFYPLVKKIMADNPGRIRLSTRHVAFHPGSDYVVALLEASRKQDKYWQTLEALLAAQPLWVINHTVQAPLARQAIGGVGLNMEQLHAEMNAPDVARRIARDRDDAALLQVTKTPEYFVNGRQMQSFGRQQLLDLVGDALNEAY